MKDLSLILNDIQIGLIEYKNKYDLNNINFILNNYSTLKEKWWHCIVVEDNKVISNRIIFSTT